MTEPNVITNTNQSDKNDDEKNEGVAKIEDTNNAKTMFPFDYHEYQQKWKSGKMDFFDENGVPYSPNMFKMWLRYRVKDEEKSTAKEEGLEKEDNVHNSAKKESRKSFPGFQYRPDIGDVVFDDDGVDIPAPGTWILNDKNELVSGPVPLSTASLSSSDSVNPKMITTPGPNRTLVLNPFLNYAIEDRRSLAQNNGNNSKMRNRCYSDSQNDGSGLSSSSYFNKTNDSGIEIDEQILSSSPSVEEFKPPLNSTPRSASSSSRVEIFVKKFQMLSTRSNEVKEIQIFDNSNNYSTKEENVDDDDDYISAVGKL